MTVLAIDTAGEDIAVAVSRDGEEPAVVEREGGRHHSERLLAAVDAALQGRPDDLQRVVVVAGPGSYSGLRVGIATARGLAIGAGCPLLGVETHAAVAAAAALEGPWLAVHPAGRGEWAVRACRGAEVTGQLQAMATEELATERIAGEGASSLGGLEIGCAERALAALRLAPNAAPLEDAVYLRAPNITRPRGAPKAAP